MERIILIGQALSRPGQPLLGRNATILARLAGLTLDEYMDTFERRNVLPFIQRTNFDYREARPYTEEVLSQTAGRRLIFLGRAVAKAFGFDNQLFLWRPY